MTGPVEGTVGGRSPLLTRVRRLARERSLRREEGVYLVEGPTLVADALAAGREVLQVLVPVSAADGGIVAAAQRAGVPCGIVDDGPFGGLTTTRSPQAALAVVATHDVPTAELPDGLLVVLADLADPGNAGTLVRSAEAFGAAGVVVAGGVDPYNPKCVRATAGALFRLPLAVLEGNDAVGRALDELGDLGRPCWATVARGGVDPTEVPAEPAPVLVLGNEPHGLPDEALERCTGLVTVPTTGAGDSLNVAVAGSVLLYAVADR